MKLREKIIDLNLKSFVIGLLILLVPWFNPPLLRAADTVLYYHNDALGSPVAMTNSGGTVIWNIDYGSFGDEVNLTESPTLPNSHRFIGKEVDSETGLHNLGARYYDPGIGRFLSVDPALFHWMPYPALKFPQRLNLYAYSNNNGLVKSLKKQFSVIPVQTGIQFFQVVMCFLDSRFRGNDDFLRGHQ
ncbi:MAG: RHS domain-containing protein [Nitrospirae bacterium]|nr:RHS domain-containing protein [Nitrospirota bacterium]